VREGSSEPDDEQPVETKRARPFNSLQNGTFYFLFFYFFCAESWRILASQLNYRIPMQPMPRIPVTMNTVANALRSVSRPVRIVTPSDDDLFWRMGDWDPTKFMNPWAPEYEIRKITISNSDNSICQ
jgi:hypothetical protein